MSNKPSPFPITQAELKRYMKRRTCPFCGGPLNAHHDRSADGRILPMTYQCRTCGRNPREALVGFAFQQAGQGPRPEGDEVMSKKNTSKKTAPEGAEVVVGDRKIRLRKGVTPEKVEANMATVAADGQSESAAPPERVVMKAVAIRIDDEPKAPREELLVFAFRLTKAERDEIHAAAGPGKASSFVKAMALGVARGDMKPIQEAVDRIHCK